jgi:glycosyltransferase involved in cell wall biosynthesis
VTNREATLSGSNKSATPPRVLHVVAPGDFGGLEQVVLQLAAGRSARGMPTEVFILVTEGSRTPALVGMLNVAGVRTTVRQFAHRAYREERKAVLAAAEAFGADVVHTHGYHPDVLAGTLARAMRRGRVSTAHGLTGGNLKNRIFEWLQRRAWRGFDVVVAVSGPLQAKLVRAGVPAAVVALCPNAWSGAAALDRASARERLRLAASGTYVGWVGRLSHEKGADVMVRAMAHVAPEIGLVMIGDGPEREALKQLANELNVASRITWAGQVQGAGQCMAAFDAFALSSRTEGTPMVLFEAMAARVPIVATAVGGVPDVVTAAEAILVKSESPEELAAAIGLLFSAAPAASARADSARRRLDENYALAPWLDRYEEFYTRATALRSTAHTPDL